MMLKPSCPPSYPPDVQNDGILSVCSNLEKNAICLTGLLYHGCQSIYKRLKIIKTAMEAAERWRLGFPLPHAQRPYVGLLCAL